MIDSVQGNADNLVTCELRYSPSSGVPSATVDLTNSVMGFFSNGGASSATLPLEATVAGAGMDAVVSVVCGANVAVSPANALSASHTQIEALPVTSRSDQVVTG